MKKSTLIAFLLAMLLLLSSCSGAGTYTYGGDHEHVFGSRYDLAVPTCTAAGSFVRYCKICEESVTTELPADSTAHVISESLREPTETESGLLRRVCSACGAVVEQKVIPPLYVLSKDNETVTVLPAGVSAMLLSDTVSHRIAKMGHIDEKTDINLARRLALLLVTSEAIESGRFTADTTFQVTSQFVANLPGYGVVGSSFTTGSVYTARELMGLVASSGRDDAVLALCTLFGESEMTFTAVVNGRLNTLGLNTYFSSVVRSSALTSGGSVKDLATLLARVLDEPLALEILSGQISAGLTIAGVTPSVYMVGNGVRISAIAGEGGLRFLVLCGSSLPAGLENTIY